ncbi:DNA invertase Pin-like site-specific DNA recombinase [Arthrobacter sp. CAN_A6]
MTKLDRLALSLSDARDIVDELTAKGVVLSFGGSSHDPTDPVGRLLFTILVMVAEFEADLIRARTREGMAVAMAKGRLKGKQPKLSKVQRKHLLTLHDADEHTQTELAELFGVSRTTVYRELQRQAI